MPTIDEAQAHAEMDGHPSVVAYRLGQVENQVKEVSLKLDSFTKLHPTSEMVALMIKPLETKITEIEAERRAEATLKAQQDSQLKVALLAAAASPIISGIVAYVVARG